MSRRAIYKTLVGDFETTVYHGQKSTEVWASAIVEVGTEDVHIFHSIDETFEYLKSLHSNIVIYYHNLKFDGAFWLYYFMHVKEFKQASYKVGKMPTDVRFYKGTKMPTNTYKYSISDRGAWYTIILQLGRHKIEFRDSMKLLPFSVKVLGEGFKTKHRKKEMEYTGYRFAGCTITDEEKSYISNDVLVVKEALEIMFREGHNLLTIGSCALEEYKKLIGKDTYDNLFPNLYEYKIDSELYGEPTAGDYIRHSYKGGWCYVVPGKAKKIYKNGLTADVNSLYPSVMHSDGNNPYPYGYPKFWKGGVIPDEALGKYYFVRIKCRFKIKEDMLPFIQIKGSHFYIGTEMLTSSDFTNRRTKERFRYRKDSDGNIIDSVVTLTLTCTDYELFTEHYDLYDFEILDGCYFNQKIGLFDAYINKYRDIKMHSKGAIRTIAKLFLNNLYGKFASSPDSSFKYLIPKDDIYTFLRIEAHEKKPGYIAVGSAVTSYARNFTIRAAQKNYHGVNERGFIYADTDSIHCDLSPEELIDIPVDDNAFCHWKLEACWDKGKFVRQKTYIEHVTYENLQPVDTPYYNIKCSGMPDRCKETFIRALEHDLAWAEEEIPDKVRNFINHGCTLDDFDVGLKIYGKLSPKRIKGGVLLVEGDYTMK